MNDQEKMYKTWVDINIVAIRKNASYFRSLLSPTTQLWSVVKSNAYGHGLFDFSQTIEKNVDGFCVDSVVEAIALRREGIQKNILVLGPTLIELFDEAVTHTVTITISTKKSLAHIAQCIRNGKSVPAFHLKIDSGMHRQGFYPHEIEEIITFIKENNMPLSGVYTHFSSAKDYNYPSHTEEQHTKFMRVVTMINQRGYGHIIKHAAATGAALMNKKYHLDAVRIGIGLYGLWPSNEMKTQQENTAVIEPVLSWHAYISEIKDCPAREYIGYDSTERMKQDGRIAIIPIGYWHGYRRGFSSRGEVLIRGQRARVLGRVSMDMIIVDVSHIACQEGDVATIIGRQEKDEITADDLALTIGTTSYEIITCINPLIKRVLK